MPRVQLPKYGTFVDFPDSYTPDQMQSAIENDVIPHLENTAAGARYRLQRAGYTLDQIKQGGKVDASDPRFQNKDSVPTPTPPPANPVYSAAQQATSLRAPTTSERIGGVIRDAVGSNTVDQAENFLHSAKDTALTAGKYIAAGAVGGPVGVAALLAHDEAPRIKQAAQETGAAIGSGDTGAAIHGAVKMVPVVGAVAQDLEQKGNEGNVGGLLGEAAVMAAAPAAAEKAGEAVSPYVDAAKLKTRAVLSDAAHNSAVEKVGKVIDPGGIHDPQLVQQVASDLLDSGNARMTNPQVDLKRYAQQRIDDATNAGGRDVQAEYIRDQIAPNAQKPVGAGTETTGVAKGVGQIGKRVATEAAKEGAAMMIDSALPMFGGHIAALFRAWRGVRNISTTFQEVMSSPGWKTASADLRNQFATSVRSGDFDTATVAGAKISPATFELDPGFEQIKSAITNARNQQAGSPSVLDQSRFQDRQQKIANLQQAVQDAPDVPDSGTIAPRAVPDNYNPTVTAGATDKEILSPSTASTLVDQQTGGPDTIHPAMEFPLDSTSASAAIPVDQQSTSTSPALPLPLHAPDTVANAIDTASSIRRGDTNAAVGLSNPIPPRSPKSGPSQLEIAGQPVTRKYDGSVEDIPMAEANNQIATDAEAQRLLDKGRFSNDTTKEALANSASDPVIASMERIQRAQERQQRIAQGQQLLAQTMKSPDFSRWSAADKDAYAKAARSGNLGVMSKIHNSATVKSVSGPAGGSPINPIPAAHPDTPEVQGALSIHDIPDGIMPDVLNGQHQLIAINPDGQTFALHPDGTMTDMKTGETIDVGTKME